MPRGMGALISLTHFYSYDILGCFSGFNLAVSLVQVLKSPTYESAVARKI